MNIWISSDFHFDHTNISGPKVSRWKSGFRTFNNISEMNDNLFNSINNKVKEDDILYFLGDFCFGGHQNTPKHRSRILCKNIHFLRGNHDDNIDLYKEHFTSINDVLNIRHGKMKYFMSHYSHRVWPGSHKGTIHLYGHSHGSIPDFGKSMDVGVDAAFKVYGEYRPFHIDEINKIMEKKQQEIVDHHE